MGLHTNEAGGPAVENGHDPTPKLLLQLAVTDMYLPVHTATAHEAF